MTEEEWLTTAEAARRLGVSPRRVRQLAEEGKVEARKLGSKMRGEWMIEAGSVVKYAATRKR